ncbi:conserved exported hypothetical protein [Bradyrhizobium sp. STM 3843]|uniref:hypothetical protein n=1 Tax=Bradyrhizobium sp. STM 3843 TaxID=551947 RepID=UPI0002407116|nr:hypothetical protein [Bradyrhizobium sp. STM 3843]CCE06392.1 conserved exported hypothetical protein [Bradyrhizobium sp. STM 3843]
MNRLWFIVWAVVIWQVAAWAFAPAPSVAPQSFTPIGDRDFDEHEKYITDARESQRKGALAALDRPWSDRCGNARKQFISGLNEYYYHRQNQSERYPETYGPAGAGYIARQWLTADDRRIERLTQEAYAAGYLKPSDFDGMASKMVATVVHAERVNGRGCDA